MSLRARLEKKLGSFTLEVELSCARGETLCIVGPSGSGKTTLLRLLAGLDQPGQGEISMAGEIWLKTRDKVRLPPQRRSVGLVFQDYSLFPHMSLWKNVTYAATRSEEADKLMRVFGIDHLRERSPRRISGGERQRGALCQALARRPRLLLLDEPFSALDLQTRLGLRRVLQRVQQDTPLSMVHVTHDLNEALFLGDRVMALVRGKVSPDWLERQLELLRQEREILLARDSCDQPLSNDIGGRGMVFSSRSQ